MTGQGPKIRYLGPGDVWLFAYGSLMWDPGFPFLEARPALLRGYHRRFCVDSLVYRGTPARPGLVLGLDRGGACRGRAYRVAEAEREAVARILEVREMAEDIYVCRRVPVAIDGRRVSAYAFVVNRADPIYAGPIGLEEAARRIAVCRGMRGANLEYLESTVAHLDRLGIADGPIHALLRRARELSG